MTVKNPYEPPTYGVRNLAIERRMAGEAPAAVEADEPAEKPAKAPAKKGKK